MTAIVRDDVSPPPRRAWKPEADYTKVLRELRVGQSAFWAGQRPTAAQIWSSARYLGRRIMTRQDEENGVAGIRVWVLGECEPKRWGRK